MNDFELEIARALQRKPPPAGFADRVLARTRHTRQRYEFALALAAVLVLAAGLLAWQRHQQSIRNQQQLIYALRLTSAKLQLVNTRLQRSATQLAIKGSL